VEPIPLLERLFISLCYENWMIDCDDCGAIRGMNEWQKKQIHGENLSQCK
jgi:hypothetical protein